MTKIKINPPKEQKLKMPETFWEDENTDTNVPETEIIEAEEKPDELTRAQTEARENYDRFVRVSAEFDNYKKRVVKDKEEYYKYANESFIKSLLPIVDYLEMGLDAAQKSDCADTNLVQGFELMASEFYKVLEKAHVEIIAPEPGCDFDPVFQECVMQQETDEYVPNKVYSIYQKGYKMYDRLLRPARVVTSKYK